LLAKQVSRKTKELLKVIKRLLNFAQTEPTVEQKAFCC